MYTEDKIKLFSLNPNYSPHMKNKKLNKYLMAESEVALKSVSNPLILRTKIARLIKNIPQNQVQVTK